MNQAGMRKRDHLFFSNSAFLDAASALLLLKIISPFPSATPRVKPQNSLDCKKINKNPLDMLQRVLPTLPVSDRVSPLGARLGNLAQWGLIAMSSHPEQQGIMAIVVQIPEGLCLGVSSFIIFNSNIFIFSLCSGAPMSTGLPLPIHFPNNLVR